MKCRKLIFTAWIMAVLLIFECLIPVANAAELKAKATINSSDNADNNQAIGKSYADYLAKYHNIGMANARIQLGAEQVSKLEGAQKAENLDGRAGVSYKTTSEGYIEYTFSVKEAGYYNLRLAYLPLEGSGANIVRGIWIDGSVPYNEAEEITLRRRWVNETEKFKTDSAGNQVFPLQKESPVWTETYVYDAAGYYAEPLRFHLTEGNHTLRLVAVSEPAAIADVTLETCAAIPTYDEYIKQHASEKKPTGVLEMIQGEDAVAKSDSMLYPSSDHMSASTVPSDPVKTKINVIGGEKWNMNGQWISWNVNVKTAGLYRICFKARQNVTSGAYSNRMLLVNGVQPFVEAGNIRFAYSMGWQLNVLQVDGKDAFVYLNAGDNELRLQASLGEIADVMEEVRACVIELNTIYRRIMMVTGPNPDPNRSYQFHIIMPDVIEMLSTQSKRLSQLYDRCLSITGEKAQAQVLEKLRNQTKEMAENPRTIASRFSGFKSNITELGSWISTTSQQPLEIDWIAVLSDKEELPKVGVSFLKEFTFAVQAFLGSFFNDYQAVTSNNTNAKRNITVWIGSGATGGRDQAQLLRQMIDNDFSIDNDIRVNLQLVSMGSLMTATLANKGPDVALSLGGSDPVNYAVRNAVLDLSSFPGFDEVVARFQPSAMVGLTFDNKTYGLPETQKFPMMFYRKDILDELDLQLPKTWDDVIVMLPNLQKKQMSFGLPIAISPDGVTSSDGFNMFLFQHGGALYEPDGKASTLNSDASIDAFEQWTGFYMDYSLDVTYDFLTRFRSGEMPIGVADYAMYNTLAVFAPEIKGLWDFCDVPGIKQPDGTINNSVPGTVTASVILSKAKEPEAAWEFLKWWTSKDVQGTFGVELEGIMGPAARYTPANMEAMEQIPWTSQARRAIQSQWKTVKGIPEVPGSYYTARYLGFAFRDIVFAGDTPGEVLEDTVKTINDEITVKRREFGLDT